MVSRGQVEAVGAGPASIRAGGPRLASVLTARTRSTLGEPGGCSRARSSSASDAWRRDGSPRGGPSALAAWAGSWPPRRSSRAPLRPVTGGPALESGTRVLGRDLGREECPRCPRGWPRWFGALHGARARGSRVGSRDGRGPGWSGGPGGAHPTAIGPADRFGSGGSSAPRRPPSALAGEGRCSDGMAEGSPALGDPLHGRGPAGAGRHERCRSPP